MFEEWCTRLSVILRQGVQEHNATVCEAHVRPSPLRFALWANLAMLPTANICSGQSCWDSGANELIIKPPASSVVEVSAA